MVELTWKNCLVVSLRVVYKFIYDHQSNSVECTKKMMYLEVGYREKV